MKKSLLFTVAVMLLLGFSSCSDKKTAKTPTLKELADSLIDRPNFEMDSQDSAEVFNLVTQYLNKLREGKIDEAVGMLYYLVEDSVIAMPAKAVEGQKALLGRFQGVSYDLESISYDDETDNLARYTVTLFEKEPNDPRPNTMSFGLNPVRREGKWFLTLSNRDNRLHQYRKDQQRSHTESEKTN
jgi:hypothetical protein